MKKLINDFPLLRNKICYLDNASTSQKPREVLDAVMQFYCNQNANVGRGVYPLAEEATTLYEGARNIVAHHINAKPHEIIFTKNGTEGINLVAIAWAYELLKKGDEIVLSELEHHSNLAPWQWVAKKTGAVIKYIPIDQQGRLMMDRLDALITSRTKLVAITQSSNAIGTLVDIELIIKKAHAVGACVLVDACQTVPHQKIDVKKMGADFLVFTGHKMLAPTGIGVLYINEKLHEAVHPFMRGGGTVYEAEWEETSYLKSPHKFEGGTPPIAQAIGLGAAINYLNKTISFDELRAHEAKLCAQLIDGLAKHKRINILGPIEQLKKEGHLVSFTIDGIHAHDVSALLGARGICVRSGHFCAQPLLAKLGVQSAVRASFYLYNTSDDVEQLLEGVARLLQEFK